MKTCQIKFTKSDLENICKLNLNMSPMSATVDLTNTSAHGRPEVYETNSQILSSLDASDIIKLFESKIVQFCSTLDLYYSSKVEDLKSAILKEKTDTTSVTTKQISPINAQTSVPNDRRNVIRKWLKSHDYVGVNKKWTPEEIKYAELVKQKHIKKEASSEASMASTPEAKTTGLDMDLFKEFSEKCNKEREIEDQKDQAKVEAAMALCKYDTGENERSYSS